jgi:hypothetical protein
VTFEFEGELWLWPGDAAWVFITVPEGLSDEILDAAPRTGGFGSVKVEVTVGDSIWQTSLFPDSKRATYVLPVKKAIRTAESIDVGDRTTVRLELI